MSTGAVTWLPLAPDLPDASTLPVWLDEERLIYATLGPGELPWWLGFGSTVQRRSERLWKLADTGEAPSDIVLGSGRFSETGVGPSNGALTLIDLRTGESRSLFHGDVADFSLSRTAGISRSSRWAMRTW